MFDSLRIPKIFYGYRIVATLWYCNCLTSGAVFYLFGLFVSPLQEEFSWSRGDIMVSSTIMFLLMGLIAPLIGKLLNRFGLGRIIAVGAALGGLGLILLSQMRYLWQFYAGYTLLGIGSTAAGPLPSTALISNWFSRRRGTAIGIMATGISAGGLIFAPLFGGFLIPEFGWRTAYLVFAFLIFAIVPLTLLVVRSQPSDMGLYPDGEPAPQVPDEIKQPPVTPAGLNLRQALATSTFWLIAVSMITSGFPLGAVMQNQAPLLEDIGIPAATVATVIAIVGLGSLIGKFLFGWMSDRIPPKYVWFISLILQLFAVVILSKLSTPVSMPLVWLYAILMGLGFGGWLPGMSMLTSTNFGLSSYGVIFGMLMLADSMGSSFGPIYAGYVYDAVGNYDPVFTVFFILFAISIPAILLVRRPKSFLSAMAH